MRPLTEKDCDLAADCYMRKKDPLRHDLRHDRHFSAEESKSFGIQFSIQIFFSENWWNRPTIIKNIKR